MAANCELNAWDWKDQSFPYQYPQNFDAAFLARFGASYEVREELTALFDWLRIRTLDCTGYEDTQVWSRDPLLKLTLHVYPAEPAIIHGGFAFDWQPRRIHAMALWHRKEPMDAATFIQRAMPETTAMGR